MKKLLLAALTLCLVSSIPSPVSAAVHHRHHHTKHTTPIDNSPRVWVNTASGVYHYQGERWYGKTKEGQFMTEKQAIAAGYRATRNGQ